MRLVNGETVAQLVAAAAAGEQGAWDRLVGRFGPLVWAVARTYRLSPADAADVSQTVWLRLVEHLDRLREPDRLPGWLVTTSRNECLRVLRQQSRVVTFDAPFDRDDDGEAVEAALLAGERDGLLWDAFRRLPEPCQLLLRLLMCEPPLSYADISLALRMPIGSIGPTRSRCLDRLRHSPEISRISGGPPRSVG